MNVSNRPVAQARQVSPPEQGNNPGDGGNNLARLAGARRNLGEAFNDDGGIPDEALMEEMPGLVARGNNNGNEEDERPNQRARVEGRGHVDIVAADDNAGQVALVVPPRGGNNLPQFVMRLSSGADCAFTTGPNSLPAKLQADNHLIGELQEAKRMQQQGINLEGMDEIVPIINEDDQIQELGPVNVLAPSLFNQRSVLAFVLEISRVDTARDIWKPRVGMEQVQNATSHNISSMLNTSPINVFCSLVMLRDNQPSRYNKVWQTEFLPDNSHNPRFYPSENSHHRRSDGKHGNVLCLGADLHDCFIANCDKARHQMGGQLLRDRKSVV